MTEGRVSGRGTDVWSKFDDAVLSGDGDVVCWLNEQQGDGPAYGKLVMAAPQLLAAVEASLVALSLASSYIPPHSGADVAGSRAVGAAYVALRQAGSKFFEYEGGENDVGD